MKKILKIILIGIVAAVTYKYLNEQDIEVTRQLQKAGPLLENISEKVKNLLSETEASSGSKAELPGDLLEKPESTTVQESKPKPVSPAPTRPANTQYQVKEENKDSEDRTSFRATITRSVRKTTGKPESKQQPVEVKPTPYSANEEYGWIKAASRRYSPNTWHLLMTYDQLPDFIEIINHDESAVSSHKPAKTFDYLRGKTRLDHLLYMGVNIHELTHAHADYMAMHQYKEQGRFYDMDSVILCFYINQNEEYNTSFPRKKLFPSKKLASVIPERYRTFRYDTYIEGNNSTQGNGVFGLMDEFHAYYIDSEYGMDMYPAFVEVCESKEKALIEWIRNTQSGMEAYYEFSFFIFEYLKYMKKHYPANYRELTANSSFKQALKRINNLFVDLVINFLKKIEHEAALLSRADELEVKLDKDELVLTRPYDTRRLAVMDRTRKILHPILQSDRYDDIKEDLRSDY